MINKEARELREFYDTYRSYSYPMKTLKEAQKYGKKLEQENQRLQKALEIARKFVDYILTPIEKKDLQEKSLDTLEVIEEALKEKDDDKKV